MTVTTSPSILSPLTTDEQRDAFNGMFRYIRKNGPFTDEQIAELDRESMIAFSANAHTFARLYRGEDEMLRKFCEIASGNAVLSIRQCRATMNAMYREGCKMLAATRQLSLPSCPPPVIPVDEAAKALFTDAQVEAAAKELGKVLANPTAPANGYYTVNMGDGTHVTLLLEDDFRDTAPAGSQIAKYLFGSENTSDYVGFAFVTGGRVAVWSKQRGKVARQVEALSTLLNGGLDAAQEAGLAYAIESGRCARCGRLLTVEASVARGLGPECAKKGWNQ